MRRPQRACAPGRSAPRPGGRGTPAAGGGRPRGGRGVAGARPWSSGPPGAGGPEKHDGCRGERPPQTPPAGAAPGTGTRASVAAPATTHTAVDVAALASWTAPVAPAV